MNRVINSIILHLRMLASDISNKLNGYIFRIRDINSIFYLPLVKKDYIQKEIVRTQNYYERENLDFVCKKWNEGIIGKTIESTYVLDVGANIGNHSLYYLNECKAKGVICFEPVKNTFNILKKNIEINKLNDRAKLYNVAVGCESGRAVVGQYDINNIGGTTIELNNDGNIDVVSVDNLGIQDKIGMIKMDVEGFELSALKGMYKLIERDKPFLIVEIRDKNYPDVMKMIEGLGYKYYELDRIDEADYRDCLFYM